MHSGFIWPSPCSALMLPFLSAVHSYTKGSMCDRISLSYLAASDNHVTESHYLTACMTLHGPLHTRILTKKVKTLSLCLSLYKWTIDAPKAQKQWQPASCMLCSDSKQQMWSKAAGVQDAELQTTMTDEGLLGTC